MLAVMNSVVVRYSVTSYLAGDCHVQVFWRSETPKPQSLNFLEQNWLTINIHD